MKPDISYRHLLAITVLFSLLVSCKNTNTSDTSDYGIIIEKFKNPDVDAKPMARMWFTDAGAGATPEGLAMIDRHITQMAKGGFGGVEVAYLSDGSNYNNKDAKEIGWGSENWRNVLKQILKSANAVEEGFKVDITITAHWPPTINTIDPNDNEASKETSYVYKKITNADIASGKIEVPLPVQKTKDYFSPLGGSENGKAPFLFVDKYIAATIAKVTGFKSDGSPIYEFSSLRDVSEQTYKKTTSKDGIDINGTLYAGYAAGIPDKKYCSAHGIDYEKEIISKFGPEQTNPDYKGKMDPDFNRKRMADWQFVYETDLSPVKDLVASESEKLEIGDYVIIGSYYRGTGQVVSGGQSLVMYNRCYATDYFSDVAVQKIFDYYSQYIFDDELIALLKENGEKNGTSIFEDSIEIHKKGAAWVYDFFAEFMKFHGYNAAKYAPLFAMGSTSSFDEPGEAERIIEDYNLVMGNLYAVEHAAKISEWAKSFNYTYRAQGYPLPGLDVDAAAIALDIPEGDNSTVGDGVRQLASAVYMTGRKMLSMESTTFTANIFSEWVDVVKELNADFSQGVSRSILHGTPFARNFNGYQSEWPGWNFFKPMLNGGGFSAWNHRQIYFDDVNTFSNYVSRLQAIVQNGQAKVDIAVLLDTKSGYSNQSGNSMQVLLDKGYSYSILSEPVLQLDKAYVKDEILAPEGPSYKALIVKEASTMSTSLTEKMVSYAQNGLPIIFYKSNIERIYGTNREGDNDKKMNDLLNRLTDMENVKSASSEDEILNILSQMAVDPAASHNQAGLEITRREANEGIYYYIYNSKGMENAGGMFGGEMPGFGPAEPTNVADLPVVTSGEPIGGTGYGKEEPGNRWMGAPPGGGGPGGGPGGRMGRGTQVETLGGRPVAMENEPLPDNSIKTTITLSGNGVPYFLDAWTGEIIPVAEYTSENDKITIEIKLNGRESMVILIASDTKGLPKVQNHITSLSNGEAGYNDGVLVHHAFTAGTYSATLENGSEETITIDAVPQEILINDEWDLELESWGPSEKAAKISMDHPYGYEVDPSLSVKTNILFKGISLGKWTDLPVTKDQLSRLGVDYMDDVSGIGYYSTTFEIPENWTSKTGAYLQMNHYADMIVEVTVNGNLIDDVNQFTNTVDVGKYLKQGSNEISIKLDTTLKNRASTAGRDFCGLKEVKLTPYVETVISES